jgi:hypothetical protein
MPNDKMSCEEAERWLTELIANPERMSSKMFKEGYEASLRKSGLPEKAYCVVPGPSTSSYAPAFEA